jgi:hypothetical protein
MAALPETPFVLLLRVDSEHRLPDSDPDVIAALTTFGAVFSKLKKHAAERLDLLAGLLWVHAHQLDLHAVWLAASVAQHRVLAKALRLDYDTHTASAPWLTMVVHKVLSCSLPGTTPQKRPAPDSSADGQIVVPGNQAGAPASLPGEKKPRKSKAIAKPPKDSSSSHGDDSSSSSDCDEPAVVIVTPSGSRAPGSYAGRPRVRPRLLGPRRRQVPALLGGHSVLRERCARRLPLPLVPRQDVGQYGAQKYDKMISH